MIRRIALVASAALWAALGAGCGGSSPPVASLHMQDLPVPAMFQAAAVQMRMPYLIEVPNDPQGSRHDLRVENTTLDEALARMVALDPEYRWENRAGVLMLWPAGGDRPSSIAASAIGRLQVSGGAGEVFRRILTEAGVADRTMLTVDNAGLRRPVSLDLTDARVRDALAEVARQAHVGVLVEQGAVSVLEVPQ